jgi:hypothetical protein
MLPTGKTIYYKLITKNYGFWSQKSPKKKIVFPQLNKIYWILYVPFLFKAKLI